MLSQIDPCPDLNFKPPKTDCSVATFEKKNYHSQILKISNFLEDHYYYY